MTSLPLNGCCGRDKSLKHVIPLPDGARETVKFAFTLAEVLITLGIIGIVAALTIPNLMSNYRAKKLQTQLQRANAIIQQAGLRMKADELNLDEVINKRDYQTIQSYFKNGGCKLPANETEAKYKDYNGTYYAATASASDLVYPFCLVDGMLLWLGVMRDFDEDTGGWKPSGYSMIAIDINGWGNKPDRYGHDVFFWIYNSKSQMLIPMGTENYFGLAGDAYIYYRHCPGNGAERGIACTAKALSDKNYFSNLPK